MWTTKHWEYFHMVYFGFYRCNKNPWLLQGDICQHEKRMGLQKWRLSITMPTAPSHSVSLDGYRQEDTGFLLYIKPHKVSCKVFLNFSLKIFALQKNQPSLNHREIFVLKKKCEMASPSSINNFIVLILVSAHSFHKHLWFTDWVPSPFTELLELQKKNMMIPVLFGDSQTRVRKQQNPPGFWAIPFSEPVYMSGKQNICQLFMVSVMRVSKKEREI